MFIGLPSAGTGQAGSWFAILIALFAALAFVLGMFWLFDAALEAIETTRPSTSFHF